MMTKVDYVRACVVGVRRLASQNERREISYNNDFDDEHDLTTTSIANKTRVI